MNPNENNQTGLNNAEDLEHIREIEAMLEKRSESNQGQQIPGQVKKYLRKPPAQEKKAGTDSTIIINRVTSNENVISQAEPKNNIPVQKAQTPQNRQEQNPSADANTTIKKQEDVKTAPVKASADVKKASESKKRDFDDSRTISMPVVNNGGKNTPKEEKYTRKPVDKSEKKEEEVYYIPLLTENDDFEFEELPDEDKGSSGAASGLKSLFKVLIYLIFVIAASLLLAVFIINVANDVFAFVKSDEPVTVVVPENCSTDELAEILEDSGAIKYSSIFSFYTKFKETEGDYIAGTYSISPSLNYDMMLAEFKPKAPARTTVTVTIPEGYTTDQIVSLLVSKGIGTYEGYERAINNYEYDFKFLENTADFSPDRMWKLDGYLYPDTYYYYSTSTEETVIYKMLDNFNNKFGEEYYARAEELGMTVDELITLASMIQKEVKYADEFGYVSSVFHNRLNHPGTYPYLDSDATIVYAMKHEIFLAQKALSEQKRGLNAEKLILFSLLNDEGMKEVLGDTEAQKAKLSELFNALNLSLYSDTVIDQELKINTKYESPYNTYTNIGLPPGPISNPSIDAIRYAMYPHTSSYYFFVSGPDGRTTFSKTLWEHEKAIDELY